LRLLLVFPFVPYPPDDGGRIGFFNPIKYLSQAHEVAVMSLMGDEETGALEGLKQFCPNIRVFQRSSSRDWYRLIRGAISDPPGAAAKYWHAAAGEVIREAIVAHAPDLVEFHHLNTASYRNFAGRVPAVLREHNVEYKVWERHAANASDWAERLYARWTAPRVRRYEAKAATGFDRCLVVSEADRAHLQKVAPSARIEVIPSGVDTEYFFPNPQMEEEPWSLTLTGSFKWKPKQQSLHTLLTEVFPRIKARVPEAKLYVVGKGVPEHLRRIAQEISGVLICGSVPDVRPYIARSALMIQYLDSGGGIALKVLEAMAMRKAVLSNTLGCEGILVKHGRDVFLAETPEEFAEAAATLLRNGDLRERLADEGHRRVVEGYSWYVIAGRIQDCYQSVLEERRIRSGVREAIRVQCAD
jgi:glycosyltransferase involved in cell wall biosynthesis